MANLTWKVVDLDREVGDGYVYTAHYAVVATDDSGASEQACGSIWLNRPNNLIPFESLTQTQVVEWVKRALGPEDVARVEEAARINLQKRLTPQEESGVPWS